MGKSEGKYHLSLDEDTDPNGDKYKCKVMAGCRINLLRLNDVRKKLVVTSSVSLGDLLTPIFRFAMALIMLNLESTLRFVSVTCRMKLSLLSMVMPRYL